MSEPNRQSYKLVHVISLCLLLSACGGDSSLQPDNRLLVQIDSDPGVVVVPEDPIIASDQDADSGSDFGLDHEDHSDLSGGPYRVEKGP